MRDLSDSKLSTVDKANEHPKLEEGPVPSIST
ncbi:TPA: hypothetical protein ACWQAT_005412 [Bacillus thuringiensis]